MGVLSGKVALVTGGTNGIGERIVEVFVAEGANVVVAARRQDEGIALEKRLGVSFINTDVSIEADVKAMIDHAVARFNRIDCLVNNAGLGIVTLTWRGTRIVVGACWLGGRLGACFFMPDIEGA